MDLLEKVSQFVTYGMVIRSDNAKRLGIKNDVEFEHLPAMRNTAKNYDVIVIGFGAQPNINQFHRSKLLNENTPGASETSQHCKAEALDLDMDLVPVKLNNKDLFNWIIKNMDFDQIIWEGDSHGDLKPDWVHVSFKSVGVNRKQILRMHRVDGKPKYSPFHEVNS